MNEGTGRPVGHLRYPPALPAAPSSQSVHPGPANPTRGPPRLHFAGMLAAQEAPPSPRRRVPTQKAAPVSIEHARRIAPLPEPARTQPPDVCIYSPKPIRIPSTLLKIENFMSAEHYHVDNPEASEPTNEPADRSLVDNLLKQLDSYGERNFETAYRKRKLLVIRRLEEQEKEAHQHHKKTASDWVDDMPLGDGNGGRGRAPVSGHGEEYRLNANSRHFYLLHAQ